MRRGAGDRRPEPVAPGVRARPDAAADARSGAGARAGGRGPPPGRGGAGGARRGGPSRARAQPGGAAPPLRVPHRRSLDRPLGAFPHRGAGARGERPQDADLAREPAGRPVAVGVAVVLPLRRDRRGSIGPGGGASAAPGRGRGGRVREERRRGRHLARERVPRLPGRRPQPALQLLLPADQRLGLPLLGPARPAGLPATGGQGPRSGRVHPLLQRGDRGPLRRGDRYAGR